MGASPPAATVFGWAEAVPESPLYQEGVLLGRALAQAGYAVRCGGYFGLMEAVALGVRQEGGRCIGVCLDMFGDKPANRHVTDVERAADLFDRLRSLIVGTDLLVAQSGSLGTVAEVAVAWCLGYLGHPDVGELHLVGPGWRSFQESLSALEVSPRDADRVQVHDDLAGLGSALGWQGLPGPLSAAPPVPRIGFDEAIGRLRLGLADGVGVDLVRQLGVHDALEFDGAVEGGLELQQRAGEIAPLLEVLCDRYRARTSLQYLEVGLGHGGTAILVHDALAASGIDVLPTGVDDLSYERDGWLVGQSDRLAWCVGDIGLRLITGTLRDPAVRAAVCDRRYDVILIDGDHSFGGCLFDVLAVLPALASGGTLLLHDVADDLNPGIRRIAEGLIPAFQRVDWFVDRGNCGIVALHGLDPAADTIDLLATVL